MPNSRPCLQCGEPVPTDAPQGLCPKCLFARGLAMSEPATRTPTLAAEAAAPALPRKPHERIGHYKILQQIGEGGCGVVYLAEQQQPVRRQVALKVIKLGMDTD